MMLMTKYGTLERHGEENQRNVDGCQVTFEYPEVVKNHYTYRHAVDDHNSRRQSPISIERTWETRYWPNRVFAFLLAVTEVNVYLAMTNIYGAPAMKQIQFRQKLARELMENTYLEIDKREEMRKRTIDSVMVHKLLTIPRGMEFKGDHLVKSKIQYPQQKCSGSKRKIRTYCKCSPGILRCHDCYFKHTFDELISDSLKINISPDFFDAIVNF